VEKDKAPYNVSSSSVASILAVAQVDFEHDYIPPTEGNEALLMACKILGESIGIDMVKHHEFPDKVSMDQKVKDIAKASYCRVRTIRLRERWWCHDVGSLLVFKQDSLVPCALFNRSGKGYELLDPRTGQIQALTDTLASTLHTQAYFFYRPFSDKVLKPKDLLAFSFHSLRGDWKGFLFMQLPIGILGFFMPIAMGTILEEVVPNAEKDLLLQFLAALAVTVLAITGFKIVQTIALMRIKLKLNVSVQSAIWDRLLRLPSDFFRSFTSGDLAFRAGGIDTIQQTLTGAVLMAVLSGAFSIATIALLIYYDAMIGLMAFGLVVMVAVVNVVATILQLKYQRKSLNIEGKRFSLLFQLLGIHQTKQYHGD